MSLVPYTTEEVQTAHETVLVQSGGESGILFKNILDSCSNRQSDLIFGMERYPGLFKKAASLMECISCFHVFVDANKRTALLCAIQFLDKNGWKFKPDTRTIEISIRIAKCNISLREIEEWIRFCSTPNV